MLPAAVRRRQQLDGRLPAGVRDPVQHGQRSDAEANRLVEWLLFNDIEVDELELDYTFNGQKFEEDSYVVWLAQPRRGLLDTALSFGVDISERISILYAPPASWSHGYLWGADVVTVKDGANFVRAPTTSAGRTGSGAGSRAAGPTGTRSRSTRRRRCARSTRCLRRR